MAIEIKPLPKTRLGVGDEQVIKDPDDVDSGLSYADKMGDREILEDWTVSRYATGIKRADDPTDIVDSTGSSIAGDWETYTMGDKRAAIKLGNKYEIIPSGLYSNIVGQVATLFTHNKQEWRFLTPDGAADDTTEETINAHREAGDFGDALVRWDSIACAVNASCLWQKWVGGHAKYEAVRPTDVRLMFPRGVRENGDGGDERGPIYSDIEDCLAVGIKLQSIQSLGSSTSLWIAYVGRSDEWEYGRCVTYRSTKWWPLPEPGDTSIIDEYLDANGEVSNPLTMLQDDNPEMVYYEYPLTPLYGSDSGTDTKVLPTSTSLFSRCLELDSSGSRNLNAANNSAMGTLLMMDPQNQGLPGTTTGPIAGRAGQSATQVGNPASNAKDAGIVIDAKAAEIAQGEGVAAYSVLSTSKAPESAAALLIRHQPQMDRRDKRIKLNRSAVQKMVAVERYLLALHTDMPLTDITVQWDPGEWTPPIPRAMLVDELAAAGEANLIDHIERVRRYHGFDTRQQAKDYLTEVAEDEAEFGTGKPNVDRAAKAVALQPRQLPPAAPGDEGDGNESGKV